MINRLVLKNFKRFDCADVRLGSLTLLAGINGMGKSTLIQSLLVLAQSDKSSLLSKGVLGLSGDFVELGRGKDVLCEDAKDDVIGITLFDSDNQYDYQFSYAEKSDQLNCVHQSYPYSSFPVLGQVRYLCAERLGPRKYLAYSEANAHYRNLGVKGEHVYGALLKYGYELLDCSDLRFKEGVSSASILSLTDAWLQAISPQVHLDIDEISALDAIRGSYKYSRKGDVASSEYRPTNVGFGISYSLPVIVACLMSEPGDLLIVENPEAHIHPQGQTAIASLLARTARSGVQVIIETHSDHIMNGVRLAVKDKLLLPGDVAFHYVEPGAEPIKSPSLDENGRLDFWPEGFFDEYENIFAKLIS